MLKADVVVAVEANPTLCKEISDTFAIEIALGKLRVLNLVVGDYRTKSAGLVPFYIHKTRNVLSTIIKPSANELPNYEPRIVKSCPPGEIIRNEITSNDKVLYIKIDLEGFDSRVLDSIMVEGVKFEHLSLEAHDLSSLISALNHPDIKGLKLSPQKLVASRYGKSLIKDSNGVLHQYEFKNHSSGPFAEDLLGCFYPKELFLDYFLVSKPGWKDIHVTTLNENLSAKLPIKFMTINGFIRYVHGIYVCLFSFSTRTKIYRLRKRFFSNL